MVRAGKYLKRNEKDRVINSAKMSRFSSRFREVFQSYHSHDHGVNVNPYLESKKFFSFVQ